MQKITEEQRLAGENAFAQELNVIHHAYVDICEDLTAGALLGQILYWQPRARIEKDGHFWIAKARADWWDEIRISPKQYDRAIKILQDKGFVEVRTMKFDGNPTKHVRTVAETVNAALEEWKTERGKTLFPNGEEPTARKAEATKIEPKPPVVPQTEKPLFPVGEVGSSPFGNNEIDEKGITSYTEITAENLSENTNNQTPGESAKPLLANAAKEFERIWQQYPKKEGKSKALRAFENALKGRGLTKADGSAYTADEIFVKTVLYRQYTARMVEIGELERRYIPTGGTWFENERWADSIPDISDKFEDFEDGMNYVLQTNRMRLLAGEMAKTGDLAMRDQIEGIAASLPY